MQILMLNGHEYTDMAKKRKEMVIFIVEMFRMSKNECSGNIEPVNSK